MTDLSSLIADQTGGWIEHDGKGMPIKGETLVHVRFGDGFTDENQQPATAEFWHGNTPEQSLWTHITGHSPMTQIVAYRIHSPSHPRALDQKGSSNG